MEGRKPGIKTTEFWIVVVIVGFCVLSATGVVTSAKIETATNRISDTAGAIPALLVALQNIVDKFGMVLIAAGAAWAYLRKRTIQKEAEIAADAQTKGLQLKEQTAKFEAYKAKLEVEKELQKRKEG